ncbi:hypothetical protein [Mycolicibacterium bacteremicum]|uniref:hypothetical protein n=1 Tax=Mycolicibacterium bacteremicum TaxID=564198 RepID=UPI0026EBE1D6|nr:hypothetical protein [Mycolicibacterium bacteremicum]
MDAELLKAAGERLLSAAQGLPDAPEPFTPSYGSDALSQVLAADVPKAEAPIIEGLPPLKTAATGTAESVIEAARRYAQSDEQLKSRIEQAMTPSSGAPASGGGAAGGGGGAPAGGAPGAGSPGSAIPTAASAGAGAGAAGAAASGASGASGAGGIGGQMGGMLGMPMQMAQQAAQVPQQVAGMVSSLPQSAMQGAQQVGEQVQQIVEQFSDKESQDASKPEERSVAGGIGERAPVDRPAPRTETDSTINL